MLYLNQLQIGIMKKMMYQTLKTTICRLRISKDLNVHGWSIEKIQLAYSIS